MPLSKIELMSMLIFLVVFLAIFGLRFVVFFGRLFTSQPRALARLRNLTSNQTEDQAPPMGEFLRSVLRKFGALVVPTEEDHRVAELKADLLRAGIYTPNALRVFMGSKLVLMLLLPIPCALLPYGLGLLTLLHALLASLLASCLGMFLPTMWLRRRVKSRQRSLRQGIPDALDMLVLCLEGGISLTAAIVRLTTELQQVHPALASELNIIHREIQLGLTVGQGLQSFADRCDLDDVRDLASVLLQSERIGASVVQALRTHADTCRQDRQQMAEEQAHKASVKIIFPTLLCIFPAVFIVLLGPAAIHISSLFK